MLKRIENDEKQLNLRYFDPLYDQKQRIQTTKRKLLVCLTKLAKLKLKLQDLTKVSAKPFERKGSLVFFAAVKEGKVYTINELLKFNPLFVFDIDNIHQTSLHISCRKGNLDAVKTLIRNGAEVNAYDLYYRTPLYFAIKYGEIDIVRYLLYSQAYPFSSNKCNFESEMRQNPYLRHYVKEARRLFVVLVFVKNFEARKKLWKEKRKVFCRRVDIREGSPKRKRTVKFKRNL